MQIVRRAGLEVAARLREGGLGKDIKKKKQKKEKDWLLFNEGGKEIADREGLKIKEREEYGQGRRNLVSERVGGTGFGLQGSSPFVLLREKESSEPLKALI